LENLVIKHDHDIILGILTIRVHDLGLPRCDFVSNGLILVASLIAKHYLEDRIDFSVLNGEGLSLGHLHPLVLLHHVDLRRREINTSLRDGFLAHWAFHWLAVQRDLHGVDTSLIDDKAVEISLA
jgi:hypothetical protein